MIKKIPSKMIGFSFIRAIIQLVLISIVALGMMPFVNNMVTSNAILNGFNMILFQPLIAGNQQAHINISLLVVLWFLIVYISNAFFKLKNQSLKNVITSRLLDSVFLTVLLIGVEYLLTNNITWLFSLVVLITLFNIFFLMLKIELFKKITAIVLPAVVIPSVIFAFFFSMEVGIQGEYSFWLIIPNIIVYLTVIALGGNVILSFTNEELVINGFQLSNDSLYYSEIEGIFPYVVAALIVGFLMVLGVHYYTNYINKWINQIYLLIYFYIFVLISILISRFSFHFPFIGSVSIRAEFGISIVIIPLYLMMIYFVRRIYYGIKRSIKNERE
ncbi:hypothetical protein EDC19_1462 [Natranaerovirga hydrolytica]|uniref:Uncharacterized protein n=1 Tax=Natranaerovirga hydrolytica TaxID=680378 RepID=A0A4V2Q0H2_9FIRM|nr:hypothetical protein [Natranaerovirga hydrolytica]TCK93271.1 hypothetical protein EDC19_1462 [Natranaerovirga hydrolytica]